MTQTKGYYDDHAQALVAFYETVTPTRTHALMRDYFARAGSIVYDIGCGSGRDIAFLNTLGYRAIGFDASPGMLREARAVHPSLEFRSATLPDLEEITDGEAEYILSCGVLMHLPPFAVETAIRAFRRCLRPSGILLLSYRTPGVKDANDPREMTDIPPNDLSEIFRRSAMEVLHLESAPDLTGRETTWHTFVTRRS